MSKVKAIIFDLDGLLLDSEPIWEKTDQILLRKRNIIYNHKTRELIRGRGQKEAIEFFKEKFGLEGDTKELIKERRKIFYELLGEQPQLLEGASGLVRKLHKAGYLLAIATGGHTSQKVKEMFKKLDLETYFSLIISSDEVERGKPDPDVYLATAGRLGVKPLNCLVLEDAVNGVLAGKKAGMRAFGVNQDPEIRKRLKEAGADKVFSSLSEIQAIE